MPFVDIKSDYYIIRTQQFLVGEDKEAFFTCIPLAYYWLREINYLETLSTMSLNKYLKINFYYEYISEFQMDCDWKWLLDFNLKAVPPVYIHDTIKFFYSVIYNKISVVTNLELLIEKYKTSLPSTLLREVVSFVYKHHKDSQDRFRLLYSPVIQNILNGGERQ